MVDNYKRLFGESPLHRPQSPLESNDHPEIDSSKFLGEEDIQKYQSLIGAMQGAIRIGRFDIAVHIMMMSSFRASPHHGHLEQVKRMVGYLSKFHFAELCVLTDEPDFSDIEVAEYDWSKSVYGNASEAVLRMHLSLWVSLSQQHTTKMQTCIMISLQANPSLPFFIS
jgi:hypothetical protein